MYRANQKLLPGELERKIKESENWTYQAAMLVMQIEKGLEDENLNEHLIDRRHRIREVAGKRSRQLI